MITNTPPSFNTEETGCNTEAVLDRFKAALELVQATELERLYHRLPDLDEHARSAIGEFSNVLVAKLLHPPQECVRSQCSATVSSTLDALQRLFRLT
jgi:glutamyl-tRNA reductase